jgi:S1-C subfamily serine protease
VKEFLSQHYVPYTVKYVDEDRAAAMEMIRRSGQTGVPVTVIGNDVVVGFDRPRLERILAAQPTNGKTPKKGNLGALVKDAGSLAIHGGMQIMGAYVGGVNPGSPAEFAGLRTGDVITAVDDSPISTVDELARALKARAGGQVKLTLARGTNRREVMVEL